MLYQKLYWSNLWDVKSSFSCLCISMLQSIGDDGWCKMNSSYLLHRHQKNKETICQMFNSRVGSFHMYIILMSSHNPAYLCFRPPFFLTHIKACLNAFTDCSPCKLKSLPLLPQNGCREKSQTFSFDRVQEITVYISSCITWVSKLSGFGGSGGYCASNTI